MPVEDLEIVPLMTYRGDFQLSKVFLPDDRQYEMVFDKAKTMRLAAELHIPVPRSQVVTTAGELEHALKTFEPPVVIKPARSCIVWQGKAQSFHVTLAHTLDEALDKAQPALAYQPILLQEFWPGAGRGQEFLGKDGKILASFEHVRVHEPQGGGGSYYCESAPLSADLLDFSTKLVEALKWDGLVMLEYRVGLRGPVLLEINGRPWGSLPLSIFAGVDFPRLFYRSFENHEWVTHSPQYRVGVRGRFLHADVRLLVSRARRALRSPSTIGSLLVHVLGFLNILTGRECLFVEKLSDPRPGIVLWKEKLGHLADIIRKKLRLWSTRRWLRLRARLSSRRRRVKRIFESAKNVLFVCHGNICRSPYAEYRLRELQGNLRNVQSRGVFVDQGGRTPPVALAIAQERGLDLQDHRPRLLDAEATRWAEIIVAMDVETYAEIVRRFSTAGRKVVFAGELGLSDSTAFEIRDPWCKGRGAYREVFDQIDAVLEGITRVEKRK
jgi:protein-tyrosine-phosphatase/predicted ATP-grasp superfamily ATP-dependent carboligase